MVGSGVSNGCYAFKKDGTCVHAFLTLVYFITIIIEPPQFKKKSLMI